MIDRPGTGEGGYVALYAGCKGSERNGMKEHQYRERYAKSLEGKGVEFDGENNVEHIWEQVKWAKVESAREVCC